MTRNKITEAERTEATEQLRATFPAGAKVHTIVRHVSQSGMTRAISVLAVEGDDVRDVSWLVARLGVFAFDRNHGGLKVQGVGMDMTFHVVYTLGRLLHDDGYSLTNRNL